MAKTSEVIFSLQPVTFRYKHELDPEDVPQFGLVAEQVEEADRDLVSLDHTGRPYTVRYETVSAMLLNEFLKEHTTITQRDRILDRRYDALAKLRSADSKEEADLTALESRLAHQERRVNELADSIKAEAAQLQQLSQQSIRPISESNTRTP